MLPRGSPGLPLSQTPPYPQALEGELQAAVTSHQEKVAELQVQLTQKEQAAEHYKGQVCWGWHGPAVPADTAGNLDRIPLLYILDGEGKKSL